jgi:hypothetical protein
MYKDLFTQSPIMVLPIVALLLFLGVFVAVLLRTFARKSDRFDAVARLPMEDSNER